MWYDVYKSFSCSDCARVHWHPHDWSNTVVLVVFRIKTEHKILLLAFADIKPLKKSFQGHVWFGGRSRGC